VSFLNSKSKAQGRFGKKKNGKRGKPELIGKRGLGSKKETGRGRIRLGYLEGA